MRSLPIVALVTAACATAPGAGTDRSPSPVVGDWSNGPSEGCGAQITLLALVRQQPDGQLFITTQAQVRGPKAPPPVDHAVSLSDDGRLAGDQVELRYDAKTDTLSGQIDGEAFELQRFHPLNEPACVPDP